MNGSMDGMNQEMQMEMMQRIPALLNLVISDEAQKEFGVEEEDLVTFLQNPANLKDSRLMEVMQQLQMLVQSMMGALWMSRPCSLPSVPPSPLCTGMALGPPATRWDR